MTFAVSTTLVWMSCLLVILAPYSAGQTPIPLDQAFSIKQGGTDDGSCNAAQIRDIWDWWSDTYALAVHAVSVLRDEQMIPGHRSAVAKYLMAFYHIPSPRLMEHELQLHHIIDRFHSLLAFMEGRRNPHPTGGRSSIYCDSLWVVEEERAFWRNGSRMTDPAGHPLTIRTSDLIQNGFPAVRKRITAGPLTGLYEIYLYWAPDFGKYSYEPAAGRDAPDDRGRRHNCNNGAQDDWRTYGEVDLNFHAITFCPVIWDPTAIRRGTLAEAVQDPAMQRVRTFLDTSRPGALVLMHELFHLVEDAADTEDTGYMIRGVLRAAADRAWRNPDTNAYFAWGLWLTYKVRPHLGWYSGWSDAI